MGEPEAGVYRSEKFDASKSSGLLTVPSGWLVMFAVICTCDDLL